MLLFGGLGLRTLHNDLWTWTGETWTALKQAGRPPGRQAAGMATDMARNRIVLFGGEGFNERSELVLLDDTWTWAGSAAQPVSAAGGGSSVTSPSQTTDATQVPTRNGDTRAPLTSVVLLLVLGLMLIGAGYALRRHRYP